MSQERALKLTANVGKLQAAVSRASRGVLLAATLTCGMSYSHAEDVPVFVDGNVLFALCKDGAPTTNQRTCIGYLMGVADTGQQEVFKTTLCIPHNVTGGQLQAVVMKYLNQHPEERHHAAYSTVLVVLLDAFPCAKQ